MPHNLKSSVVIGLGRSGLSILRHLLEEGKPIVAIDTRKKPQELKEIQQQFPQISLFLDSFDEKTLAKAAEIIVSPGIAPQEPALVKAKDQGIPVIGDIELFARAAKAPIIGITGTNAKGTVTTLVGEMIQCAGLKVLVGGNIGIPALDLLAEEIPDFYVLELSSFQLETTYSLQAAAATILNISDDHLDRHGTMLNYIAAKQRIYQDCQAAVVNREDERIWPTISSSLKDVNLLKAHATEISFVPPFGKEELKGVFSFGLTAPQAKNEFGILEYDHQHWLAFGSERLMPVEKLLIKGRHNWNNALAALALGTTIGLPLSAMLDALSNFRGLAHRCEWVAEIDGVIWYDDSKGTNVGATLAAIEGLGPSITGKLILIAGGLGKNADFTPLRDPIKQHVRSVILIGKDAPIMEYALAGTTKIIHAADLAEAVGLAKKTAQAKDVVLLSPACASFDMFRSYEHRGEVFKELVRTLISK